MYHYIRNNPNPNDRLGEGLSVSPARFEEQMAWLTEHGYEAVSMADLLRAWQGELALPPKTVVLTFDDGYADAYTTAAPILARHGFRGTVFVVNRFVGKPGYLSLEQLQSLKAAGWEIGFHSNRHIDLTRLSASQLQTEVVAAAAELRQLVDAPVDSFAYPSGRYSPQVVQALRLAGIAIAVTTQWGIARPQGDWLLQPRLRIAGQLSIAGFAALFRTP